MKKIELVEGINASVIGFGCSPIMGPVDSKTGKYAIDMAIEYGVNYFDVARSYGYGEAKGFLGKTLKSKKNEVYISTKFGIKPNWKANSFKKLKPIIGSMNFKVSVNYSIIWRICNSCSAYLVYSIH